MTTIYPRPSFSQPGFPRALKSSIAVADQDFITPDGQLVPHSQGAAALHQGTAFLIGGMLIGSWPE